MLTLTGYTFQRQGTTIHQPIPEGSESAQPAAQNHYVFPVQGCQVTYGPTHHNYPAADIFMALIWTQSPAESFPESWYTQANYWDAPTIQAMPAPRRLTYTSESHGQLGRESGGYAGARSHRGRI
jgi:hypothetical protein